MTDVYVLLPGTAAEALAFYAEVFGGEVEAFSYADFGRSDGPPDAVAHGVLRGPVPLSAADAGADEDAVVMRGMMLSLLGAAPAATLHRWFDALAAGGRVVDPLQRRAWGASDGRVVDRFGLTWLLGYEEEPPAAS